MRGAVDYFVLNRDEVSDLEPGGFVDDAEVVNQVARDLGLDAAAHPHSGPRPRLGAGRGAQR